jgi:hypothetical protein
MIGDFGSIAREFGSLWIRVRAQSWLFQIRSERRDGYYWFIVISFS